MLISITEDLKAEHQKVEELIEKLDNQQKINAELIELKNAYRLLKTKVEYLVAESKKRKNQKDSIEVNYENEKKSLSIALNNISKTAPDNPEKKLARAVKLQIYNLNGKPSVNDKKITISFKIAEYNKITKGNKKYYVQVLDPSNKIIGANSVQKIGDEMIYYNYIASFNFQNKPIKIEFDIDYKLLNKGIYTVNIYDANSIIARDGFVLD